MMLAAPRIEAATIDPRAFRDALGRFATGVALFTAAPDDRPAGLIVNSVASVSLDPPARSARSVTREPLDPPRSSA